MKNTDVSKEQARASTEAMNDLMSAFQDVGLDPEFAGYLLISSGISLVTLNNPEEPLCVLEVLSKAIRSANQNVYDTIMEENEADHEDDEDDEGVRH